MLQLILSLSCLLAFAYTGLFPLGASFSRGHLIHGNHLGLCSADHHHRNKSFLYPHCGFLFGATNGTILITFSHNQLFVVMNHILKLSTNSLRVGVLSLCLVGKIKLTSPVSVGKPTDSY